MNNNALLTKYLIEGNKYEFLWKTNLKYLYPVIRLSKYILSTAGRIKLYFGI